jgi:hypothetical protein
MMKAADLVKRNDIPFFPAPHRVRRRGIFAQERVLKMASRQS